MKINGQTFRDTESVISSYIPEYVIPKKFSGFMKVCVAQLLISTFNLSSNKIVMLLLTAFTVVEQSQANYI